MSRALVGEQAGSRDLFRHCVQDQSGIATRARDSGPHASPSSHDEAPGAPAPVDQVDGAHQRRGDKRVIEVRELVAHVVPVVADGTSDDPQHQDPKDAPGER